MKEDLPRFHAGNIVGYLDGEGIDYTLYRHTPVFTVAEAQAISLNIPGAHCRNLFLRDKKENMFLLTLREQTPVDLKKLSATLGGGRLSFGSPERLWAYLGVRPGSVTPLAVLNDGERKVRLVLEEGMFAEPLVNFHPLDNSMTVGMSPRALLQVLENAGIGHITLNLDLVAPDDTTT